MAKKRLTVTLVIEEDLLRKARAMAVTQESHRLAAWERIQPLLD